MDTPVCRGAFAYPEDEVARGRHNLFTPSTCHVDDADHAGGGQ